MKKQNKKRLNVSGILFATVCMLLSVVYLVYIPGHFSVTILSVIVFCIYSLYARSLSKPSRDVVISHGIVVLVLLVSLWIAFAQTNTALCSSFYGVMVDCLSYENTSYIIADAIGFSLVGMSLRIVSLSRITLNK